MAKKISQNPDADMALNTDQKRRMLEMRRSIAQDVEHFVGTIAEQTRAQQVAEGEEPTRAQLQAQEAAQARMADEITAHLKKVFAKTPHTTGALTEQLLDSQRQLAAKAFMPENTPEETAFYAGITRLYLQLCEVVEQEILFGRENLPPTPSSGRTH